LISKIPEVTATTSLPPHLSCDTILATLKLLHFADIHIGMLNYSKLDPTTGLESRLIDFFNTLDFIIDYAIKEQVDAVIFAGDAYKTRDPSPTQQRGFGERIKRVPKAGIPLIMVVGNHDTPNAEGKANTLDIYSALEVENMWVSRKSELINIPTKSGNLQVITAPWLQKSDFKSLGADLPHFYSKINPAEAAILVGHLEVEGASMGSEKGLAIINDATIPLSLLTDKRLSYVALGHIHKYQNLNPSDNPPVIYSGSPERIDFGEIKEDKGFVMIEILKGIVKYQFVKTPARDFVDIHCSLKPEDNNPTQTVIKEIKKHPLKDCIVKLTIDIPAGIGTDLAMDQVKKALVEAYFIAGISRNLERVNREMLEGGKEMEKLMPLQALQKYWQAKKYDQKRIAELEKYASELLS